MRLARTDCRFLADRDRRLDPVLVLPLRPRPDPGWFTSAFLVGFIGGLFGARGGGYGYYSIRGERRCLKRLGAQSTSPLVCSKAPAMTFET